MKYLLTFLLLCSTLSANADPVTQKLRTQAGRAVYDEALKSLAHHDYPAAAEGFRKAAEQSPHWAKPWLGLAQLAMDQGRPAEAEASLRKAAAASPKNPELARAWGRYYLALHQPDHAKTSLREAMDLAPSWSLPVIDLADLASFQGHNDEAAALYQKALAIDGGNVGAHFALGNILARQGKWSSAQHEFEAALHLAPGNLLATEGLAGVLVAQKRLPEAEELYRSAVKASPQSPDLHLAFGDFLLSQSKVPEAIEQYKASIQLNNRSAAAQTHLGVAYALRKDSANAERAYRSALAIESGDRAALNDLARLLIADRRNLDEAITLSTRAQAASPNVALYAETLGMAQQAKGDWKAATTAFKRETVLAPASATAWYQLGVAYQEAGQAQLAEPALTRSLQLDAKFENAGDANARLSRLKTRASR